MNYKLNKKKGFALLMAIMIGSLFLAIGATIYRIALVEIILSSTGRDSQFAFYAADTGLECALYWNYHYGKPSDDDSGSAFGVGESDGPSGDPSQDGIISNEQSNRYGIINLGLPKIECMGAPIGITPADGNFRNQGLRGDTSFNLNSNGICAEIEVKKRTVGGKLETTIISHGYNTCEQSDRRVERAIKATLQ